MEISLVQLFATVIKRIWIIIFAAVFAAFTLLSFSLITSTPTYTSSTKLYVITQNNTTMTTNEVLSSAEIVSTYIEILKSRTVLEAVAKNCDLGYSGNDIKNMIVASQVEETPIFQISVTCKNPNDAQRIAYEIADVGAPQIKEIVNAGDVKVVDQASEATENSPGHVKKAIIGFALGLFVSTLAVVLIDIFDNRIKTEMDITDLVDYPIVGVIPQIH